MQGLPQLPTLKMPACLLPSPAGPCVSTDTACSSSLVATHLAHKGLLLEECSAAVAAGSNIMLLAGTTAAICQLQALSPVGRCKTFEASADGYGRGEGVAALVLRRQAAMELQALSATGAMYAVVRGSAVNQGGRSSGLTAPSGPAQTSLLSAALASGGLPAAQLGVVSVHGTGTPLGDPIEVGALSRALPGGPGSRGVTLLSNKSCYGHTEGAAGITGLLLSMAALHNQAAPEVMHLRSLNPYVAAAMGEWGAARRDAGVRALRQTAPTGSLQQLAGTSSFGMSGVNAHMLVSQAGDLAPAEPQVGSLAGARPALWGTVPSLHSVRTSCHRFPGMAAQPAPRARAAAHAVACGGGCWRYHCLQLLAGQQPPGIPAGLSAVRQVLPARGCLAGNGSRRGSCRSRRQRSATAAAAAGWRCRSGAC